MRIRKATSLTVLLALLVLPVAYATAARSAQDDVLRWVDPFIGTGAHGHTYPGATVPFGMVQLSPDNGQAGWDWSSGYHRPDSMLVGFGHTHLSGTGIGDLVDVVVLPYTGALDPVSQHLGRGERELHARFRHTAERASPGSYAVRLDSPAVNVELTATTRVGWHRYTFPADAAAGLFIDLGFAINWDAPIATGIELHGDSMITGWRHSKGWAPNQKLWFAAKFSRAITGARVAQDSAVVGDNRIMVRRTRAALAFAPSAAPLLVKVAVSYVDAEGALKNLAAEGSGWAFDSVRAAAAAQWAGELAQVRATSPDTTKLRIFYTALYHSKLAPIRFDDVDRRYRGGDGQVHHAATFDNYSIFSLWDTFRAEHPLFTILTPQRVDDMINSMLAFDREHGLLPVWSLVGDETNTMTGYHAIPVIADAYLKGIRGFDANAALAAMRKSAMQDARGLKHYRRYGYIPSELEVESVTKTLEYAYDDAAIARMAFALGDSTTGREFTRRAGFWQNLFDPSTRFMRGKRADGKWRTPFDPKRSDHRENTDYTEGNAWQHTWFVPQDVPGLIARMGGDARFIAKLDSLFEADTTITGEHVSADISGLIGQYAHGNEPSHHIAYLYSYAGAPWKTAERVHTILSTLYRDDAVGLAGNEDCGQMSAWYVLSALGFYPVDPVGGVYVFGTPAFERAELSLEGGRRFTIEARGLSERAIYIQSVTLNGREWPYSWVRHEDIMAGGELVFVMGERPSPSLGVTAASRPPIPAGVH